MPPFPPVIPVSLLVSTVTMPSCTFITRFTVGLGRKPLFHPFHCWSRKREEKAHSSLPKRGEKREKRPVLASQRGKRRRKEVLSSLPEEEKRSKEALSSLPEEEKRGKRGPF